jgi:hypothetical protein
LRRTLREKYERLQVAAAVKPFIPKRFETAVGEGAGGEPSCHKFPWISRTSATEIVTR